MEFKSNSTNSNTFGVPCVVADNLLKIATGSHIKVLLYILRCSGKDCTEEEISLNTGVSPQEVTDAVYFWQQANVLILQQTNNVPPAVFDMTPPAVKQNVNETVPENPNRHKQAVTIHKKRNLTGSEILNLKMTSPDIAELLSAVQSVLGTVNNQHISDIVNMYQDFGLKKEVIMILIGYCKEINKTSPNYIYTVACQWTRDNIDTQEQAEKEVQKLLQYNEYKNKVMRTLNVERFTELQENMIKDWNNWHITMDMVKYAYETSLPKCENKLSINYINGIIKKWHEKGIETLQGAVEDNESYRQEKSAGYSRKETKKDNDFDVDMYSICINNF